MATERHDLRRCRCTARERNPGGRKLIAVETAAAAATSSAAAIETYELAKAYGSIVALRGLTLHVARGEVFGFLGPNGAGKTTAVKLLLGLVHPTSGNGVLLGAPLGDRAARKHVGYLPELFRYQEWLSASEVLAFHCALARIPAADRAREIAAALETVGLDARAGDRLGTYSKGMQQRLGLAVALLGTPDLIFLDEPTSALDPLGRHDVREIISRLRARGSAVFLNSHLLTEVERVCDRVAMVDDGRVIAAGTLDALLGGGSAVRLRLGAVDAATTAILQRAGTVKFEDGWHTVEGLAADAVPQIVATLVQAGASVYAVEPMRTSLEELFLRLMTHAEEP